MCAHLGHRTTGKRRRGVMLLGLLIGLALAGIGLMAMVDNWALQRQREREAQLLFVGEQYRQAIRHYYYGAPNGQPRQLPASLQDMLEDDRFPTPVRHLRRLYPDPLTGSSDWGELRVGDRLAGIYSRSDAQPLKQAGFAPAQAGFAGMEHYQDWVFAFTIAARFSALPVPPVAATAPGTPRKR
jgi:type II secretory pathway pseudopilin PulG